MIGQLSTIVHECGHFLDLDLRDWGENVYVFTDELTITCEDGSTPDNGVVKRLSGALSMMMSMHHCILPVLILRSGM